MGDVCFDVRFEGNRGWVHGGYVAAGFDVIAVSASRLSGTPGVTGTLSVKFLAPARIGEALRYEGWWERVERRKVFVRATLHHRSEGTLLAEAEGISIARA